MNEFLKGILDGINTVIGNYGWSIVVFTLLLRIVLFPFDYKSRVSMRKTTKLQPQLAALQKKYANDKEKLNRKMSELPKRTWINMGVIWSTTLSRATSWTAPGWILAS